MRVAGIRADGAVWLNLDGGLSVILREDRCSPAVDPLACEKLGPWDDAHGVSGSDRREIQQRLDRAHTMPLVTFLLDRAVKVHTTHGKKKYKFEYSVTGDDDDPKKADGPNAKVIGDAPEADPIAVAEGAVPEALKKKAVSLDKDALGHGSDPGGGGGGEEKKGGFFAKVKAYAKDIGDALKEDAARKQREDAEAKTSIGQTARGTIQRAIKNSK